MVACVDLQIHKKPSILSLDLLMTWGDVERLGAGLTNHFFLQISISHNLQNFTKLGYNHILYLHQLLLQNNYF